MAFAEFEKDFGYLMPFLEKVAAAANSLSDSAARAELTQLIADEKIRWARARQLLSGDAPAPHKDSDRARTTTAPNAAPSKPERPALSFTVGSLRSPGT